MTPTASSAWTAVRDSCGVIGLSGQCGHLRPVRPLWSIRSQRQFGLDGRVRLLWSIRPGRPCSTLYGVIGLSGQFGLNGR
eukprot:11604513-Heterocapsa_arctica.AAC.1